MKTTDYITKIDTLQDHTVFLFNAIRTAKRRVIIVTPFISIKAINSDNLAATIESVINGNGISVTVYSEVTLNEDNEGNSALEWIQVLRNAGVRVVGLKKIHNITLIKDDEFISEGTFNWLSSEKKEGVVHQCKERTMVTEGIEARCLIEKELAKLNELEKDEEIVFDKTTNIKVSLDLPFEVLTKGTITWLSKEHERAHNKLIETDFSHIDNEDDDWMCSYSKALAGDPISRAVYGLDNNLSDN